MCSLFLGFDVLATTTFGPIVIPWALFIRIMLVFLGRLTGLNSQALNSRLTIQEETLLDLISL